jgi:predicted RNA-binding protein with PUA-like domain
MRVPGDATRPIKPGTRYGVGQQRVAAILAAAKMVLVNNSRLSVQPVTDEEWKIICTLGGVK